MKHDKKHKKNKSPKRSKKSKQSKEKKHKNKSKKKRDKKLEKTLKTAKEALPKTTASKIVDDDDDVYCGPSIDLMNRAKCPETKAEYDHRQNQIKRVVDSETGRIRLIKGDGEILEEIVTRDRHKQINHEATRNDGYSFQRNTIGSSRK